MTMTAAEDTEQGEAKTAAGTHADEIEQLRQQMLPRTPTVAEKAKAIEARRRWNEKANAPELAGHQQRLAILRENNDRLKAVGELPFSFAAADDPRDLTYSALRAQNYLVDRLIREQVAKLESHAEAVATAEWEATLAAETPVVRWLVERLAASVDRHHAAEARITELEAMLGARAASTRSAKTKPLLSHAGTSFGDGLTPGLRAPPADLVPGQTASVSRRISSAR